MIRSKRLTAVRQLAVAAVSLLGVGALAGCGVAGSTPSTNFNPSPMLQGQALAGRNYLPGARVTVYATTNSGTWNAAAGAYSGTAKVLGSTTTNTVGAWSLSGLSCSSPDMVYVVVAGGHPYTAGSTVTASIDAGLPDNPNSLMMTAMGDCSVLNSTQVQQVTTNEASTVAAVEALQRFMTVSGTTVNVVSSATNYAGASGTGTATSRAGLKHAFDTALSLSSYSSAAFNQVTNSGAPNSGGIVPVQLLNGLAYIQYLCTIGGDDLSTATAYPYCANLFSLATPPGGTKPASSLEAMLNIARNPANNAAALLTFSLTKIPFSTNTGKRSSGQLINDGVYVPAISSFGSSAAEWTVGIQFPKCFGSDPVVSGPVTTGFGSPIPTVSCAPPTTATTASGQQTGLVYPLFLALDSNDNVYVSNPSGSSSVYGTVVAISNNGQLLWSTKADATNSLTNPRAIAVDNANHVFVVNQGTLGASFIEERSAASGAVIQKISSSLANLYGIAVDPLGNLFYSSSSAGGQIKEATYNSSTSTYTETTFAVPAATPLATYQLAIDSNFNVWTTGSVSSGTGSVFYMLPNTGSATAPAYAAGILPTTTSVTTGGPTQGVTINATNNAFTATSGTGTANVYKATVTGSGATAVVTNSLETTNATTNTTRSMMTDGAGKIWWLENGSNTKLYSYVPGSAATPTGYLPCYFDYTNATGNSSYTATAMPCVYGLTAKVDLGIDSSGNVWVADATTVASSSSSAQIGGTVVKIVGVAAPTVPNKSLVKVGIIP